LNTPTVVREAESLLLEFDDNSLLPLLFGSHNSHLAQIEQRLDVTLNSRGNEVVISGPKEPAQTAAAVLTDLYQRLKDGQDVDPA
jgi:phosphate starvation-inducible PhoH-like protein